MLNLPPEIAAACADLFAALPFEESMPRLLGSHAPSEEVETALQAALRSPALASRPALAAGLWLYVDNLERSHELSQSLDDATGAYWHGIMHRREGDFSNSHYWMRRAIRHSLRQSRTDLDPDALIDAVAQAGGNNPSALVARQREEWQILFEWCATNKG